MSFTTHTHAHARVREDEVQKQAKAENEHISELDDTKTIKKRTYDRNSN